MSFCVSLIILVVNWFCAMIWDGGVDQRAARHEKSTRKAESNTSPCTPQRLGGTERSRYLKHRSLNQ